MLAKLSRHSIILAKTVFEKAEKACIEEFF